MVALERSNEINRLESSSKTRLVRADSVEANMTQRKHPLKFITASLTIGDCTGSTREETDDVQKTYTWERPRIRKAGRQNLWALHPTTPPLFPIYGAAGVIP